MPTDRQGNSARRRQRLRHPRWFLYFLRPLVFTVSKAHFAELGARAVAVADADIEETEETLTRQACAQGVTSRRAPITVRN